MGIYVLLGVIAFIMLMVYVSEQEKEKEQKTEAVLRSKGEKLSDYFKVGTYVGGHPQVDSDKEYLQCKKDKDFLQFYTNNVLYSEVPTLVPGFKIPIANVRNILVEDDTTIQRKITAGRLLLVGVFAFAWKKKKKEERAFVVIEWNDGRFDHVTTFLFSEKGALQSANVVRNALIRTCSE